MSRAPTNRTDASPMIVGALRTPIGTAGRSLATVTAPELAADVLAGLCTAGWLRRSEIIDVVLGNCTGPGGDVARGAALAAGLPGGNPPPTLDPQCGRGPAPHRAGGPAAGG